MDIKFMNQPKEIKLGNILNQKLKEEFDEIWIASGFVKDSGIELLMDSFESAINNGAKLNVLIGVDRKNTSKDILLKLLTIGANLSIHVNTEEDKTETRIYAFESNKGSSYIYVAGGKLSEGGLLNNSCIITEIKYSVDEKDKFKVFKHQLLQGIENIFKSVDREDILLLAKKGEILTRIIEREIPSINELYGNKEQIIGEKIYDESGKMSLFNVDDLENVDIEFEDGLGIRENVELSVEKEESQDIFEGINKTEEDLKRLLGSKDNEEINENKKTIIIKDLKENDYKNMTTLIIEAGKVTNTGVEAGKIKIPKNLAFYLKNFFNLENSEEVTCKFEFMDNEDGKEYGEKNVILTNTAKGLVIAYEGIANFKLGENDILRIVKITNEKFRCEIIRAKTEEYSIWERYCVNTIRGTERRFGII